MVGLIGLDCLTRCIEAIRGFGAAARMEVGIRVIIVLGDFCVRRGRGFCVESFEALSAPGCEPRRPGCHRQLR